MTWIIFLLYWIFFSWLITRISFFRNSGLSNKALIALFSIKILAGLAYIGFYSLPQYSVGSDTLKFHYLSIKETDVLLSDPGAFVKSFFTYNYQDAGNLFLDNNSYWNDLKNNVIIKLFAIINVFTGKGYHAAIVFFNFLFFFGVIGYYQLLNELYPGKTKWILACLFALPSFLFWSSGIHKDGLLFSAIGLFFLYIHRSLQAQFTTKRILLIAFLLLLLFSLRNYVALALIVVLPAIMLMHRYPNKKLLITSSLLIVGITLFFSAKYIHPSLDFPKYIAEKQGEFLELRGGSEVAVQKLYPTFTSFISFTPTAIDMAFLRPHIGEWKNLSYIPASIELVFFWLMCILCIIYRKKYSSYSAVVTGSLIFCLIIMLLIGYTVMFSGAIVRYRALLMPLILAPLILNTDLKTYWYDKKKYLTGFPKPTQKK